MRLASLRTYCESSRFKTGGDVLGIASHILQIKPYQNWDSVTSKGFFTALFTASAISWKWSPTEEGQ